MTKRQIIPRNTPVFRPGVQIFSGDALLNELKSRFLKITHWVLSAYQSISWFGKIFILDELEAIYKRNKRFSRPKNHYSRKNKGHSPKKMPSNFGKHRHLCPKRTHTLEGKIGINLPETRYKRMEIPLIPSYLERFERNACQHKSEKCCKT